MVKRSGFSSNSCVLKSKGVEKSNTCLVPTEIIENRILYVREERVMLDADLADLYEVSTKVLNQAVKRNKDRFPSDFMFTLNQSEKNEVVTNCDHLRKLKFSYSEPKAFTEQGIAMLSSVLNSKRAVLVNIQIMRAFIKMRKMLYGYKQLHSKIEEMEKKYDHRFRVVFDAIRQMLKEEEKPMKIGFLR